MNKSIERLYGLNAQEQKLVGKIFRRITGKKNTETQLDSLVLQQIIIELHDKKLKKNDIQN